MLGVAIEVSLLLAGIKEPGEGEFPHEDDIAELGLQFRLMAFIIVLA
jgi:hypothetical protein